MKKEDFQFMIDSKKEFEFVYNGIKYNLTYGKDSEGKEYINFGRLYEGKNYYSYKDLMNNAKIENHFFKDMIEIL